MTDQELIKGYQEEIRDLKIAIRYANALYHGKLQKLKIEDGYCPLCGAADIIKNTLPGQKIGGVSNYTESPPQTV